MTHAIRRPRKTIQDLLALGDDVRAELIEGEIYVAAAPDSRHQDLVLRLGARMLAHLERHGGGRVFVAPLDVHLSTGDVVQPDVVYVAADGAAAIDRHVRGAPDLLVEVVSAGNAERDRIVKRRLYEQNGVREYWILEPEEEAVEVLRLESGVYRPAGYLRGAAQLSTPFLPGFGLLPSDLFA